MHATKVRQVNLTDFPLLSFFTGGGLLDIGFLDAGFSVVWHNECVSVAANGYEYAIAGRYGTAKGNLVAEIQNRAPIQEVPATTIELEAFGGTGKPALFGAIGGPPCPDFSSAGLHKGKEGTNGYLLGIYVSKVLSLEPTFFLLENVAGLLRTAKHRDYLSELLQQLECDYSVDVTVLNSLDFGVPQDRSRVFVVGFRHEWLEKERGYHIPRQGGSWGEALEIIGFYMYRDPRESQDHWEGHWFPWPYNVRFAGAKWKYDWPQTSPLGGQPAKPADIPEELMVGTHIGAIEYLASLPNGKDSFKPYSPKFDTVPEGDVKGKSFKRLHRWRYSPTAAYGNREVHLHPFERRRLTVREAMRIQSVPDDYSLPDSLSLGAKFRIVSNGVPVKLARELAEQIASFLIAETPIMTST
jgi:DNA (cytosine-5)-methyltransferase 1